MTTSTPVRTDAQLLYVSIDLGSMPSLSLVSDTFHYLDALYSYSVELSGLIDLKRGTDQAQKQDYGVFRDEIQRMQSHIMASPSDIGLVRTSIASPLVTVLGELAKDAAPIGYALTGLFGIQKLMEIIMNWQQHKVRIRAATIALNESEAHEQLSSYERATIGHAIKSDSAGGARYVLMQMSANPVLASEMIASDDPRATG